MWGTWEGQLAFKNLDLSVNDLLLFLIAFLMGVGAGRVLRLPLMGALAFGGLALTGYLGLVYFGDGPEGVMGEGERLLKGLALAALRVLGYAPAEAERLIALGLDGALQAIALDALARVKGLLATGVDLSFLRRLDLAFLLGMLASLGRV